ncbi:MAG: ATP-binding protein [Pseudomonadota bacterium]
MRRRPSISVYLIGMNMLLLCIIIPTLGFLFIWKTSQFRDVQLAGNIALMQQDLTNRSSSLVRSMGLSADQSIAGFDFSFLQNLVAEVVENDPEIVYCLVVDKQLTVVAHNEPGQRGRKLSDSRDKMIGSMMGTAFPEVKTAAPKPVRIFWPEKDRSDISVLEVVVPVYSGSRLWGVLRCGFSLHTLNKAISAAEREWAGQMVRIKVYVIAALCVFLLAAFLAAIVLTGSFVRDTRALHDAVQLVANGDLNQEILLSGLGCKEFSGLAASFNTMTERLRQTREKLDEYSRSLEDKVAERTRALKEAQYILLKQAHEAGMVEMAVGVLHNIGNAITPVKVVSSVLLKNIEESPLKTKLAPSLLPLKQYLQESTEVPDRDKKRLLRILEILPAGIAEEYESIVEELKKIRVKHDHIENIIALQMRYARLADTIELVNINSVARDALNMLADTIKKRDVQVDTDFTEVPLVRIEETKLLQVFVNLIKNGYEAMDNSENRERKLMIQSSLEKGAQAMVRLSVADTGCGFSEEEKRKFFTFGYTTKNSGSGFGLHTCANYLKANNGSIEASSKGPGRGAVFVVRLPAWDGEEQVRRTGSNSEARGTEKSMDL